MCRQLVISAQALSRAHDEGSNTILRTQRRTRGPRDLKAKSRLRRVIIVTLGLVASGLLVGAILGAILPVVLVAIRSERTPFSYPALMSIGALFGAVNGAVLAPIAAWSLMRHVPIWRAIAETATGTAIGAFGGLLLGPVYGDVGVVWP